MEYSGRGGEEKVSTLKIYEAENVLATEFS
jgi:hypothetical protein